MTALSRRSAGGAYLFLFLFVSAFSLAGFLQWFLLGVIFPRSNVLTIGLLLVTICWCCVAAVVQARRRRLLPTVRWQVPARWVGARPLRQTMVWAITLGGGFYTRNPFAAYLAGLLLALAARSSHELSITEFAAVGLVHGAARALGIVRAQRSGERGDLYAVLAGLRWRGRDAVACALTAVLALSFLLAF